MLNPAQFPEQRGTYKRLTAREHPLRHWQAKDAGGNVVYTGRSQYSAIVASITKEKKDAGSPPTES